MKVIIQIPCFNEEGALPITLQELPRQLNGVDKVEWLVINDGSQDKTVEIAIANRVDYVISHINNLGLAQSFLSGMTACVHFGADIVVNTDADNQYYAEDIQKLIDPILRGEAEYVLGTRPINSIKRWSFIKKKLQIIGSWVVQKAARINVTDAPSGFRAITRSAAMRLHVFNRYTYTLETIIQAGHLKIPTVCVPIRTHDNDLRPSRLMSGILHYLKQSSSTIIRSFMTYDPMMFFTIPAGVLLAITFILGARFLYFFFIGNGVAGHIQSLILALAVFILGISLLIVGFLSDLIAVNRQLLENIDHRLRVMESHLDEGFPESSKHAKMFNRASVTFIRK